MAAASAPAAGLPGRYAAALFDLAHEARALDATEAALGTLEASLEASPDLRALIADRLLSRRAIGRALVAVAADLDLPASVSNFLGVLAANGRAALLPATIAAFRRRLAAHRGEATAQVVAAHKLSKAQAAEIAAKLKARTGRDMTLEVIVDPAILGGLVVRIGSEQIDDSVKTRLERLGARMKGL
jgi:F-type H+-transporting ATPase subunit delta